MLSLDLARARLPRLVALPLALLPEGVGAAALPPGVVVVPAVADTGMPGAVAMRLAALAAFPFRDELRRKLNLDMRGDDEMGPSPP